MAQIIIKLLSSELGNALSRQTSEAELTVVLRCSWEDLA